MQHEDTEPSLKKQKVAQEAQIQDGEDSEDELPSYMQPKSTTPKPPATNESNSQLYLDTINRHVLDFDFEKMCSVTLATVNVYCCLVCGKYFRGRSMASQAYGHSLNEEHHVFVNLDTEKFYVLPDDYEIKGTKTSKQLADIKLLINPTYTLERIEDLATPFGDLMSKDLNGKEYQVGFIGLNNISQNDYANVVLQILAHIEPFRDFYLKLSLPELSHLRDKLDRKSPLNSKLGLFIRKFWSGHLYRNHVSPHELLQLISTVSKKKFSINQQSSPKAFLVWLLNQLHMQLVKITKSPSTVVSDNFQGNIRISSTKLVSHENENTKKVEYDVDEQSKSTNTSKFWILTLDLPPYSQLTPGVTDRNGNELNQVPQVSLLDLLSKYNGSQTTQVSSTELRTYRLLQPLPRYLFIHVDRGLEENNARGNPTVVKDPFILNMAPFTDGVDATTELNYMLKGNITHQLIPGDKLDRSDDKHKWSVSVPKQNGEWVTIDDLKLTDCEKELLFLKESYIQVWERCQ